MASKKIVVLKLREIIYTAIFLGLGIILILLLLFMFSGKGKDKEKGSGAAETTPTYRAGVYTTDIALAEDTLQLEVIVDSDRVKSVRVLSGSDTELVATMYPLMEPAAETISSNLALDVPLEEITFSSNIQYTGQVLVDAVGKLLEKATAE